MREEGFRTVTNETPRDLQTRPWGTRKRLTERERETDRTVHVKSRQILTIDNGPGPTGQWIPLLIWAKSR